MHLEVVELVIGDVDGPVVVLSPHLDDAVLSAWAVLRQAPAVEVQVVVVFAGVPAEGTTGQFDPIFGATDSAALVRQRRDEDIAALGRVGLVPVHLDLLDDQYRTEPVSTADLVAAISAVAPAASVVVAPAGIGRHPDHVAVRDAAFALVDASGVALWVFADQPYASNLGWPSWVTGEPDDPYLVPEAAWGRVLREVAEPADLDPVVTRFDDAEREAKLAASRCYASQWPALEGGPHRRLSNPAIAAFEVRWRVRR